MAKQLVGVANPFVGVANPFVGVANPFVGEAKQLVGVANPFVGVANPFVGVAKQLVGVANPFVGVAKQLVGVAKQLVGEANPFVGVANPFVGVANPFVGVAKQLLNGRKWVEFPHFLSRFWPATLFFAFVKKTVAKIQNDVLFFSYRSPPSADLNKYSGESFYMAERPFPKTEAEIEVAYNNWVAKLPIHGAALGVTAAQQARLGADAANFAYIRNFVIQLSDSKESITDWKNSMFYSEDTNGTLSQPQLTSVNLPENDKTGMVTFFRQLWKQIKVSPNWTEAIGEDFGQVIDNPYEPQPESLLPVLRGFAQPDGVVVLKFKKMGQTSINLERRIQGTQEWHKMGMFTNSPATDMPYKDDGAGPKAVEYRGRLVNKDVAVGQYSSPITVITIP